MSKRRNRNTSPNLSADALARAREQLAQESAPSAAPAPAEPAEPVAPRAAVQTPSPVTRSAVTAARTRSSTRKPGLQPVRSTGVRENDRMDSDYVRSRLDHPTRIVTEADLRSQYSYVLSDLRQMGLLSVGLIILLLILGSRL